MRELVGEDVAARAEDVELPTVNGYAYYRYSPRRDGGRCGGRQGAIRRLRLATADPGSELADVAHPAYVRRRSRVAGPPAGRCGT